MSLGALGEIWGRVGEDTGLGVSEANWKYA